MASSSVPILALKELVEGQEADLFLLLTSKQTAIARNGSKYWKVSFRDADREVGFPIWSDSQWAEACESDWRPGEFYKVRASLLETSYGSQLDIQKIRPVGPADHEAGFDPAMCQPRSRFDPAEMWNELLKLVDEQIEDEALQQLVNHMLTEHAESFQQFPAARRNHHAYVAGLLEHVLSVTKTALFLAEKYQATYPDMQPPLDNGLVVAGAVLHDIGKLREYDCGPEGAEYSPGGHLIGHILQGRDMVREAAQEVDIDDETLLRLEHTIVAHQRLPEYGSPKRPMTPEALLVHYADDIDAKMNMVYRVLRDDALRGPMTSAKNVLGHPLFRGLQE